MCLYPSLVRNPRYKKNKKNGGIIPAVKDIRTTMVPIGCNKCIECRKQKARGWQVRLLEDIKTHKNGIFVTLTFSNESYTQLAKKVNPNYTGYDLDNAIATYAVRKFLERWRKKYKVSLRHWLVTELGHGTTQHLHLHGIVWTNKVIINPKTGIKEAAIDCISEKWQYGYVWPTKENIKTNYVNESTINYSVKYISKMDFQHKLYNSIVLTSPGIGHNYTKSLDAIRNSFNQKNITKTNELYKTRSGHNIAMPTYWRNKIYSEEQRQQLWLMKLDKNERWVLGQRINVAYSDKYYKAALKSAQRLNEKLGYLGNVTWELKRYENDLRSIKQAEKFKAAYNKNISTESQYKYLHDEKLLW